jgi:type I restriction enzyme M protein
VNQWWTNNVSKLEALPTNKNVFELYKDFAVSIASKFSQLGILDLHKSRGAFAAYWSLLETDLKSIAASGWNAELIPADDILKSQFPEVLEELANNEAKRDELEALFNEVNELEDGEFDEENYEVFPVDVLKQYKDTLKEYDSEIKENTKKLKEFQKRYKANSKEIDKQFKTELREAKQDLKAFKKEKNSNSEKEQLVLIQDIELKIVCLQEFGLGYSDLLDGLVKEITNLEPKNNKLAFQQGLILAKLDKHTKSTIKSSIKCCFLNFIPNFLPFNSFQRIASACVGFALISLACPNNT